MKTFDPAFSQHIASGATTLCTCWLIERSDGVRLGFTDHDVALEFDGQVFLPACGLEGSEVASKLGAQVDTSEVTGFLHSEAISAEDILLGRYLGARVTSMRVNWRDVNMRGTLRVDLIGEISRHDGIFRAELRSMLQLMNIAKGRRYNSFCDTVPGSVRCGIDLEDPAFSTGAEVALVRDRFALEVSGTESFETGWFSLGAVLWQTGKRILLKDRLASHSLEGETVVFRFDEPVGDWIVSGDQMRVYAGCAGSFSVCREKFSNGINFQGFPHIPGNDFLLSYPRAGDSFSGSALVE